MHKTVPRIVIPHLLYTEKPLTKPKKKKKRPPPPPPNSNNSNSNTNTTINRKKLLKQITKEKPHYSLSERARMVGYSPKGIHTTVKRDPELQDDLCQIIKRTEKKIAKIAEDSSELVSNHVEKQKEKGKLDAKTMHAWGKSLDYLGKYTEPETPQDTVTIGEIKNYIQVNIQKRTSDKEYDVNFSAGESVEAEIGSEEEGSQIEHGDSHDE